MDKGRKCTTTAFFDVACLRTGYRSTTATANLLIAHSIVCIYIQVSFSQKNEKSMALRKRVRGNKANVGERNGIDTANQFQSHFSISHNGGKTDRYSSYYSQKVNNSTTGVSQKLLKQKARKLRPVGSALPLRAYNTIVHSTLSCTAYSF